ncbi:MAG: cell surface protein, partial [Planctomyces sp.]
MTFRILGSLLCTAVFLTQPVANLQGGERSGELLVFPAAVSLTSGRDIQKILVLRRLSDGSTEDVTAEAEMEASDSQVFRLVEQRVHPVSDGSGRLLIRLAEATAEVPVTVTNSAEFPELNFRSEVLATLTKAGCNSGKCHGAASGKDGFRLSLFGYDPEGDQYRLTREIPGRRVNVAAPDRSLLIQKALGNVDHTGGQCIQEDTAELSTLLAWIRSGAPADPPEAAAPVRLRVYPEEAIFAQKGSLQQL